MRADPHYLSQETARRMADRFQWALQQREQHLKRMEELRKEVQAKKTSTEQVSCQINTPISNVSKEAGLVAEMVRELYEMNPEIAARRQAALQVTIQIFLSNHCLMNQLNSARRNARKQRCANPAAYLFDHESLTQLQLEFGLYFIRIDVLVHTCT